WPTLRFAAGLVGAYVLLQSSGWCLAQLAARGAPALGGVMFVGPGAGIVASGLLGGAMVAWQWRASSAWLVFRRENEVALHPPGAAAPSASAPLPQGEAHGGVEVGVLAFAYGIAG